VQLLQLLLSGIAQGCIYGLIALGFVLIDKATETVSFAQGDLMVVGAFGGMMAMALMGFPFWLAVPAAIIGMGLFGVVIERLVIRPILGQPAFSIVMLAIGVGYVLRGFITMIPNIGTDTHVLDVPYAGQVLNMGSLVVSAEQIVVILATAMLCGGLFALFNFTKLGIAMQAASQPVRFWANKYQTKYNEDPTVFSVNGYSAVDAFLYAASKAGNSLTNDRFIKVMNNMKVLPDMFGSAEMPFSATKRLGSNSVRMSQLQYTRWKVVSEYSHAQ
jgi:hypothetical protein